MSTRLPALFSVFLVSALLTRAGLAGASESEPPTPERPAPLPRSAPPASTPSEPRVWTSAIDLRDPAIAAVDERTVWRERITARLDALARDRGPAASVHVHAELQARVDAIAAKLPRSASVAIEVRDLDRGHTLASLDRDRALAPASTHKLITAIAAVELLGPDYRFATRVLRSGDTLILRGEGDPDLQLDDLHALVDAVVAGGHAEGVRRILVDDGVFSPEHFGPGFDSEGPGDSFRAPSDALALHWSTVVVTVRPTELGEPVEVDVSPASPFVVVDARAHTGSGALHIDTQVGPEGTTIVSVRGALPVGHAPTSLRRRVIDPGLVAAGAFARLLGERLGEPEFAPIVERGATPRDAQAIALHESEPLVAVLASALQWSNNFTAEQILRTLAWRASGEPGDWTHGVDVLERFAAALSPEQAAHARFVNGSGLTREGRATPALLVDVLALGEREGSPAALLRASMASAGEGTLHNRVPGAGDRLQAKTGTYAGASALAGLVHDGAGRRTLGFAVLVNGGSGDDNRALQDELASTLLKAIE
ncbi:D-alanyl-D-alanine carboxypeptidase/D-alanyl-D-alanine-endopeptidase [Nannocystaceae bacterium ST9]